VTLRLARRHVLLGIGCGLVTLGATDAEKKRLENRLELWANFARRTKNLMARLTTTRETSLLDAPLVATGTAVFSAPSTLVLRDDGLTGSTTYIDAERVAVAPNQTELPRGPELDAVSAATARWLGDRLLALFQPGDPDDLVADTRVDVPRGKGYRLELLPPRGSPVRQSIRSITVHFDPVAGAVTQALLAEAQGDRLLLQFTDHRQNVDEADVTRVLDAARELVDS
jgi:hypothetical protein